MSDETESFGRRALICAAPGDLLVLEQGCDKAANFLETDLLFGRILVRMLQGNRVVSFRQVERRGEIGIEGLTNVELTLVERSFGLANQESRGAWFLPEEASLKVGVTNLAAHFKQQPRYAHGLAREERGRVDLRSSAQAVLFWAILEPLGERLFQPLELRASGTGTLSREEQHDAWSSADTFFGELELDVGGALDAMRYGRGWSKLNVEQQLEAKLRFVAVLGSAVTEPTFSRYRAVCLRSLISQYYAKAKDGKALRKRVLTREYQRVLSGFFEGDWLAFLRYIGEDPHPNEQISTTLPEPRIYVGGADKVRAVAVDAGVEVDEVERILRTYWGASDGVSPVDARVSILSEYWAQFDMIHAKQSPGDRALWGFVDEGGYIDLHTDESRPYQVGTYRALLPEELVRNIESMWSGTVLTKFPFSIVSEPFPHAAMAEAFGPALKFWHGCGLTAWFLCEGPQSRTDMAGLEHYHRKELAELAEVGCPVDAQLFKELKAAERKLGPAERIISDREATEVTEGLSMTIETSFGERRRGFEGLRDVITRHRQKWALTNLEKYLRLRWVRELTESGRVYNRVSEANGKPPSPKQFARHALSATNHWFGGDLSLLYGALGERFPGQVERHSVMPADRVSFVQAVFKCLGGEPFEFQTIVEDRALAEEQLKRRERNNSLEKLAFDSLHFVQLEEALGRKPTLKDFGPGRFEWPAKALSGDMEVAWVTYSAAIGAVVDQAANVTRTQASTRMPSSEAGTTSTNSGVAQPVREKKKGLLGRLFGG